MKVYSVITNESQNDKNIVVLILISVIVTNHLYFFSQISFSETKNFVLVGLTHEIKTNEIILFVAVLLPVSSF